MIIDDKSHSIVFDSSHDPAMVKFWQEALQATYTKEYLGLILRQLVNGFPGYDMRMSADPLRLKLDRMVSDFALVPKREVCDVLARIYSVKSNRPILLRLLTPAQLSLWKAVYTDIRLNREEALDITGVPLVKSGSGRYSWRWDMDTSSPVEEYAWFSIEPGVFYSTDYSGISLPDFVRRAFQEIIIPVAELAGMWLAGSEEDAVTSEFENQTLELLPVLNGLYLSGKLERGRMRVSLTVVKRLVKQLEIKSFNVSPGDTDGAILTGLMLVNAYSIYADSAMVRRNSIITSQQNVVRDIAKTLSANTSMLKGTLLLFLGKVSTKLMESASIKDIFKMVTSLLVDSRGTPVIAAELYARMYTMPNVNEALQIIPQRGLSESYAYNDRSGERLDNGNYLSQLVVPAVLSVVALYASLGMLSVTYSPAKASAPYPLRGLLRMQLTPLGMYALGITGQYTNDTVKQRDFFEADGDSLIIRALHDNNPYEALLCNYTSPIGGRRYMLTPKTFLSGCARRSDIEARIKEFRSFVGIELPPVFDSFFNSLLEKSDCFEDTDKRYIIYKIKPDATELLEAIVSDPEIRSLVVRAENYMILVPLVNKDKLDRRLKAYGFLLP